MNFLFGCDPEFFLKDKEGKFVSAYGLFPGTKQVPYKLDKGAMQVDGLALEFNIDPVDNAEDFNKNIEIVLTQMNEMILEVDKDLSAEFTPFAQFQKKYFEEIPDEAKILGCDPDFNYTGNVNPCHLEPTTPIRTAAGHIHIGFSEDEDVRDPSHFEDCRYIANKFFNSYIFNPKTIEEKNRHAYYGNYGAFRPKSYGVELRAPSNLWIRDEESRKTMFNKVKKQMDSIVQSVS